MSTFYVDNFVNSTNNNVPIYSIDGTQLLSKKNFIYSDLQLDLEFNKISESSTGNLKDIKASTDSKAITNSLMNLLKCRPGQMYLNPEVGLNLEQFLFLPITPFLAFNIKEKIKKTFTDHEPRIQVLEIEVEPDVNKENLNIKIIYNILSNGLQETLFFTFNSNFYDV